VRLLIVEDDTELARLVADGLEIRGFRSDIAPDLAGAKAALSCAAYGAVILDLGLPDGEGIGWLRKAQGPRPLPPTLILTGRDGLGDRVNGLDSGADDYLVKPVDLDELAARVRALLRRPGPRSSPVLEHGSLSFDVATRIGRKGDTNLNLTRREADLFELLMRRPGTVVSKSSIADTLYAFDDSATPNAIEATVSRLRHKIAGAGASDALVTVRGIGYLLKGSE
jgi:two-component system response regulator QseB